MTRKRPSRWWKWRRVPGPIGAEAARWLIHLGATRWKEFKIEELLKTEGLYDPANVEITKVEVPVFEGASTLPPAKDILALQGDPAKGKLAAARCIMCHELEGQGVNFGPDLRGWDRQSGGRDVRQIRP